MRLASWAICGSLLINVAFGLVVAGAVHAAHPAPAPAPAPALAHCTRHTPDATRRPVSGHYLAAVRLGWAVG
jgi:hypothetical protein